MAGRGPQTFKKRQKEQQRKEKQQEKIAKRLARKHEKPAGEETEPEFPAADQDVDADVDPENVTLPVEP